MTWKSFVGLSWLNRYAQVPMDSRAFMESSLSRIGRRWGLRCLTIRAGNAKVVPAPCAAVLAAGLGRSKEKTQPRAQTFREPAMPFPGLTTLWVTDRHGQANPRIPATPAPPAREGTGHDRTTCLDTPEELAANPPGRDPCGLGGGCARRGRTCPGHRGGASPGRVGRSSCRQRYRCAPTRAPASTHVRDPGD